MGPRLNLLRKTIMFKKSCDTVPLRHLNGFAALLKSNTLNRTNTHKIISAMSARENFLK